MYRIEQRRPLPAMMLLSAICLCEPLVLSSQVPTREATDVPPPAAARPSAPVFQATPEEIGDALMAHQRYQEAIGEYKQAPQNSADVWNKMGIAYQLMFDSKDAMQCYKKSMRLNSRNAHVVNNLGTVYDSLKDYRRATHYYNRALKLDPDSALIAKNLGTNLLARRKYQEGWEMYKRALALNPHVFDERGASLVENTASAQERGAMNYYMAKGCVQAGLTDQAIEYLRLAMSEGFANPKKVAEDTSFARLKGLPAFQKLMTEQTAQ
jgi:tetratricopeptide (TPR) repeat protein